MINLQININQTEKPKTSENRRSQQEKIEHQQRKRSTGSKKSKRSSIKSKSNSKSPTVVNNNKKSSAFMCQKCIRPKSYLLPKKADVPKKEKPEKLRPSVICPIHGHIQLEFETDDTPRTYQKMNHNPINDYDEGMNIFASNKDQMISESLADTINSVEISKRIRDSIEFTSMTHSARESHKVVEKFKFSDAEISDAMVSEIR